MSLRRAKKSGGLLAAAVLSLILLAVLGCAILQPWNQPQDLQPTPSTVAANTQATTLPAGVYRDYIYGGLPKATQAVKLLKNKGYLVGYSEDHRDPVWVAYRLVKVDNPPTLPRPTKFMVDERTDAKVKPSDYDRSGYDRGHMAPNHAIATRYGEDAQLETFLMSNICPQRPNLNRKVWEELEKKEADDYANRFKEVWVIDGPIFDDEHPQKLPAGVDVPVAFYKILVDEDGGRPHLLAFIMPQTVKGDEAVEGFLTSVRHIEDMTHLDFFTELDPATEKAIEAETPKKMW